MVFLLETGKYSFVTFLDFFIRDYFHFFGIVEFTESIVVNFFLLVIVLILYYCVSVINSLIYDGGIFFILLNLDLIISSYFITKILKKMFAQYMIKYVLLRKFESKHYSKRLFLGIIRQ